MAKKGRAPDGQFTKGWPGGNGGKRPGAGRKKSEFKEAAQTSFKRKLRAAEAALNFVLKNGEPADRLRAAQLVYAYALGKPVQRIETERSSNSALDLLERADQADLAETALLGKHPSPKEKPDVQARPRSKQPPRDRRK